VERSNSPESERRPWSRGGNVRPGEAYKNVLEMIGKKMAGTTGLEPANGQQPESHDDILLCWIMK
jgi:hypothetical protein